MKYILIYNDNKLIIYNARLTDDTVPYTEYHILIFNLKSLKLDFIVENNLIEI